jgi:hypothetical protein
MTASEALRRLHETPLAELGGRLPDHHPFIDLWHALPEIRAVMEAAEAGRQWSLLRDDAHLLKVMGPVPAALIVIAAELRAARIARRPGAGQT